MAKIKLNLQQFGEGGAGAAPAGTGEAGGEAAVITPGTLDDGTRVDNRLAARMEAQAKRRQERGEAPAAVKPQKTEGATTARTPDTQQTAAQETPSLEDEWTEARKGKFKELYSRDVQNAIQDRFKNQKDANEQLAKLQPALAALARQRGIDENNLDELAENILADDTLFEEEAEKAGMTVDGYRTFQQLEAENKRLKQAEAQEQENMFYRQHLQKLAQQAEELKKRFPNFDLMTELQRDENFRRLTAPNSGLSVEEAYYALHHKELEPQVMAYGIQRAQQQMAQTIQANRMRPTEGAMKTGQPADVSVDVRSLTKEQRQNLIERARRGEKIVF